MWIKIEGQLINSKKLIRISCETATLVSSITEFRIHFSFLNPTECIDYFMLKFSVKEERDKRIQEIEFGLLNEAKFLDLDEKFKTT